MELIKEKWTKSDIKEFQLYLKTFENSAKREWASNLLKTNLSVLCLDTPTIKKIVNDISKGEYLSFLDYMVWEYYENTAINGFLICKIKNFDVMRKYLDIYSDRADNWATCDLLSFDIKGKEKEFYNLALEYMNSIKPFVRRIGLSILFNYIKNEEYIDKIYLSLDKFQNEDEYYVNMMIAWLLCECFIKQRQKTLKYLKNNHLNKFSLNKGIQKCRESNRITIEDKEMLLNYKIK